MKLTKDNHKEVLNAVFEASGLTKKALSERIGVSRQHVMRLLGGVWEPRMATLQKFMDACGADLIVEVE